MWAQLSMALRTNRASDVSAARMPGAQGLQIGADDCLAKPFDPNELVARMTALLRRVGKEQLNPVLRFQFGAVSVDCSRPLVTRNGAVVNLAAKEMQLLRCLVGHRGQVLARE